MGFSRSDCMGLLGVVTQLELYHRQPRDLSEMADGRGSVPCRRVKRRAVARDGGLNVFGEIGINGSRRVFGKQRDTLGDGAANRLGGMKNSNGPRVIFDD